MKGDRLRLETLRQAQGDRFGPVIARLIVLPLGVSAVAPFVFFAAAAGALGVSPNLAAASCRRGAAVRVVNRLHRAVIAGGASGAASARW